MKHYVILYFQALKYLKYFSILFSSSHQFLNIVLRFLISRLFDKTNFDIHNLVNTI